MDVVNVFRDEAAHAELKWGVTGECKALVPGALAMLILLTYWGNIVGALKPRRRSFRSGGGSSNANATNPRRAQEMAEMRARQAARADAAAAAAAARAAALAVRPGRCCPPRPPTNFDPSFVDIINGIM
jgi:predicted lipid-binding transport protein (Tim44 family)